ncbi:MAG: hypothetical protein IPG89_22120 [Bacteroidetes bacterium]|nr:hypothetical protein [Bacteroidota bacterium]
MKLSFNTKAELFKHLKDNKSLLVAEKKATLKQADAISYGVPVTCPNGEAVKSESFDAEDLSTIKAEVVINTTNILDSHGDVHMKGIWKKSLSEKKLLYLLQEHEMKFDKVITDELKASVKKYTWAELGFKNFEGTTEALVFDAVINADRNEYMFEQYIKGRVKNHSVGMQYVNIILCINSDERYYAEEKANYDKYIKEVVNKEDAEALGYFWAVTEAKVIEGSAVLRGSNYATPTLSVTETKDIEADVITSTEPQVSTQIKQGLDYNYLFTNLKLK